MTAGAAADTRWLLHRAGPLIEQAQCCSACGQLLLDNKPLPAGQDRLRQYARGSLVVRLALDDGVVITGPAPAGRLPAHSYRPCTPTPKDRP